MGTRPGGVGSCIGDKMKKFCFVIYVIKELTVLVSGVLQSDSVIHIYASVAFQILFPLR